MRQFVGEQVQTIDPNRGPGGAGELSASADNKPGGVRGFGPIPATLLVLVAAIGLFIVTGDSPVSRDPITKRPPVDVFAALAKSLDEGDLAAAASALVVALRDAVGVGTAQWPGIVIEPAVWVDGRLNPAGLEAFVAAAEEVDVTLEPSECKSSADGRFVIVTCAYVAASPQTAELGHVHGVVSDGAVAGLIAHPELEQAAPSRRRATSAFR